MYGPEHEHNMGPLTHDNTKKKNVFMTVTSWLDAWYLLWARKQSGTKGCSTDCTI